MRVPCPHCGNNLRVIETTTKEYYIDNILECGGETHVIKGRKISSNRDEIGYGAELCCSNCNTVFTQEEIPFIFEKYITKVSI